MKKLFVVILSLSIPLSGCEGKKQRQASEAKKEHPAAEKIATPAKPAEPIDRQAFNAAAVRLDLPLFWKADTNGNGRPDPDEIVGLMFYDSKVRWTEGGKFTVQFEDALQSILADLKNPLLPAEPAERRRVELVRRDLDQGRPTLVYNDLSTLSPQEKKFFGIMVEVAGLIDELYARQLGIDVLRPRLAKADPASRRLFARNWGPDCKGPETENNPECTAISGVRHPPVGIYPAELQEDKGFCKKLGAHPDSKELMAPFVAVREKEGKLVAVPFNEAWPGLVEMVSDKLEQAAAALEGTNEKPLQAYLKAAAGSFRTNDWHPADEAWAAMNAENSRWYVRVAPDEVYWEPCSRKAGFHLTLARINTESIDWQKKLTPARQDMENELAKLAGPPYKARKVSFHLPDFIDIVINAGDDRDPFGATIGQSLPNWGPVANEGRGRTVVMTNLYTDPDSVEVQRRKAASMLCRESFERIKFESKPDVLGTILHEAAHNLGPAHEYRVGGKTDSEIFGGPLASTMEELKAQTAALFFLPFLVERGLIDRRQMTRSYQHAVLWMLGHISRGMYDASGKPKPYSQLSAIQLGYFLDKGAVEFRKDEKAANGRDTGCLELHVDKFPRMSRQLMKLVAGIKARGDRTAAQQLVKKYVEGKIVPHDMIKERVLRFPKASFVYSWRL